MRAEAELLNALIAEHGKFVSACGAIGTDKMAERYGISRRGIQKRRQRALDEKSKSELKRAQQFA
jgi:hypothetical protein